VHFRRNAALPKRRLMQMLLMAMPIAVKNESFELVKLSHIFELCAITDRPETANRHSTHIFLLHIKYG